MIHRFAEFEVDERRRELRLRGREIVLQPRIFDLLLHLVRNRDRVLTKDELLEAVWPGVIVSEGALHRAVSLVRSALRHGGAADAIRTQARVGYRFCVERVDDDAASGEAVPDALERGRRAYDTSRWDDSRNAFAEADGAAPLGAADLERWAMACQYSGAIHEAVAPLERAVAAHGSSGDPCGAARAALHLGNLELERREVAVAQGWRNRAASLLKHAARSSEHGLLTWLSCRIAIFEGDLPAALEQAEATLEIARELDDPELEALALNYEGLVHLALGNPGRGVPLHDEAAAAVLAGQVGPWAGGMIFCSVIWSSVNRGDWQRANQWCEQFDRWVRRYDVAPFPGLCRLHRAEVLTFRGSLDEAERELLTLRDLLSETAPYAEGDLFRVLGEVRMARDDLDGADAAFRRACELGWDPQPGWAMLQVRQGKAASALRALERSLADPDWVIGQRRGALLAHLAVVALAAGEIDRARSALAELEARPGLVSTPSGGVLKARARAELDFAEGRRNEAIAGLRHVARGWQEIGSPLAAGGTRIRLAEWLREDGDDETAELELAAAERVFRDLGLAVRRIREE